MGNFFGGCHIRHDMSKITALACAVILSVTSFGFGQAAGTLSASQSQYKSQGIIKYSNDTATVADDVIFDASDFLAIDAQVTAGKKSLTNILNEYTGYMRGDTAHGTRGTYVGTGRTDGTEAIDNMTFANLASSLTALKAGNGMEIVSGSIDPSRGNDYSFVTVPPGFYDGGTTAKISNALVKSLYTTDGGSVTPDFSSSDSVTYTPTNGWLGLSSLTIDKDPDLIADNIKKGVTVNGITGTLRDGEALAKIMIDGMTTGDLPYTTGSKKSVGVFSISAKASRYSSERLWTVVTLYRNGSFVWSTGEMEGSYSRAWQPTFIMEPGDVFSVSIVKTRQQSSHETTGGGVGSYSCSGQVTVFPIEE